MPPPRWRRPNFLLIVCVAIGLWLVLVPLAGLLLTAFTEDTGLGFGAFTLDNFVEAYSGARLLRLIGNSVIYAAGTAIVTFVIGGFVAWAVERTDAPGAMLFHNLALLSFAIPGLLMAMAWIFVLSPNIGWVNAVLKSTLGLKNAPFNIYSMTGMIWSLSSHYFPLAYLALRAGAARARRAHGGSRTRLRRPLLAGGAEDHAAAVAPRHSVRPLAALYHGPVVLRGAARHRPAGAYRGFHHPDSERRHRDAARIRRRQRA